MAIDEGDLDERPYGGRRGFLGCWASSSSSTEKRYREANNADNEHYEDDDDDGFATPSRKRRRLNTTTEECSEPSAHGSFGTGLGLSRFTQSHQNHRTSDDDEYRYNNNNNNHGDVYGYDHSDDDDDNTTSDVPTLGDIFRGMTSSLSSSSASRTFQTIAYSEPPVFFPISQQRPARPLRWGRIVMMCLISFALLFSRVGAILPHSSSSADDIIGLAPHIIPNGGAPSDVTLREFLTDKEGFSLGMAPSFFGFYGYFGTLAAWEETVAADLLQPGGRLNQVAGASSGAMAAILLAAGVSPLRAAKFCAEIELSDFADFPGILSVFQGNKFELIMEDILAKESPCFSLLLEEAMLPVAVSAFDLQTMAGQILTTGSMARAARASASFPFLFQPVAWEDDVNDYTFIDGGIGDTSGVAGLKGRNSGRVVNLKIGPFLGGTPPLPSEIEGTTAVVSISLQNMPQPNPWKIELGPIAVKAASNAMKASLDLPLLKGKEKNHYELHIDASTFWSNEEDEVTISAS